MAVIIASTHFAYPRRDGQAELAWVAQVVASLWRVAIFKNLLGAARHFLAWEVGALYTIVRHLNRTTLLTYLFPKQKIHVRAPPFCRTGPSRV